MNHLRKQRMRLFSGGLSLSICLCAIFFPISSMAVIHSRSAIVVEALTGKVLFAKDADCRLPPASTTKLMTAIVAMDRLDLADILTVAKSTVRVSRPRVFKIGDRVSVEQLLYASLIKSANDAAVALAEAVCGSEREFVDLMNRKAISIGAENTKFINSTGLPGSGQYTTVLDLSTIMKYVLGYPKLREILATPVAQLSTARGERVLLKNTDKLLSYDKDLIGGKTGYTAEAEHCFVGAAERENKRIIVAVLRCPNRKLLWKETEDLIHKGFDSPPDVGQQPEKGDRPLQMNRQRKRSS